MAAQGSRTLKLSLLADVAEFSKGIKTASKDTETIGDQFTAFGKKAAVAFAAAGAAIGAFAIASVKAAAEDETGQRKLEETIRNTTSATADQIAGIDKYITAQSIATATTDDVIRPALSRLLRATGDLTKAQELLTLSQEISVATGKPLEAVTNALGKAFEGSNTALSKLGIGIDKTTLSTLTFDQTQQLLNKTFDGFIENQSETAAFKFQQISIAVNESKEAIGAALLPVVKELADFLIVTVVPAIESFVAGLTGKDGLAEGLTESQQKAVEWGKKVRSVIDTVIDLKDELIAVAVVIGTVFVVSKISAGVVATIALINTLIKAYNALKASAIIAGIASAFALNPLLGVGAVALAAGVLSAANAFASKSDTDTIAGPSTGSIPFASGFGPGAGAANSIKLSAAQLADIDAQNARLAGVLPANVARTAKQTQDTALLKAQTAALNASRELNAVLDRQSGQVPTFNAGTFRTAEAATSGATYNINVSGAFDRERTAREIVDTINDSFYRGTGGANNLQLA
jgi:hypothetical protein